MHSERTRVLVVGYGSTLRADDGVGPKVAEKVAALGLPNVHTLAPILLTPELADPVSQASRVIFVDAIADGSDDVLMREILPAETSQVMTHAASPETLLALARDVFGRAPRAWLITIPGDDFGAGETFSRKAAAGVAKAVAILADLLER